MCVRSKVEVLARVTVDEDMNNNTKKLRLQKRQAMQKHTADAESVSGDTLAWVTAKYRHLLIEAAGTLERFQHSKAYQVLFRTTQPAHVVSVCAVATVSALLFPRSVSDSDHAHSNKHSPYTTLVYLASFMIHYGAQMWMTFISGLSLYFALPRHTFGSVQRVLFPRYFGYNSFLSLATLAAFVRLHPSDSWSNQVCLQVFVLVLCFVVELTILLYVTPPLLKLISAKIAIEKAAGVGLEVGQHNMGPLAACPHYLALHKAFRTVHMCVAMGNIVAMACTTAHLWYLANKICLL